MGAKQGFEFGSWPCCATSQAPKAREFSHLGWDSVGWTVRLLLPTVVGSSWQDAIVYKKCNILMAVVETQGFRIWCLSRKFILLSAFCKIGLGCLFFNKTLLILMWIFAIVQVLSWWVTRWFLCLTLKRCSFNGIIIKNLPLLHGWL